MTVFVSLEEFEAQVISLEMKESQLCSVEQDIIDMIVDLMKTAENIIPHNACQIINKLKNDVYLSMGRTIENMNEVTVYLRRIAECIPPFAIPPHFIP